MKPYDMRWQQLIRLESGRVDLAADVNAAVNVNRLEPGATTNVEAASHARVVQNSRIATNHVDGGERIKHEKEDRHGT